MDEGAWQQDGEWNSRDDGRGDHYAGPDNSSSGMVIAAGFLLHSREVSQEDFEGIPLSCFREFERRFALRRDWSHSFVVFCSQFVWQFFSFFIMPVDNHLGLWQFKGGRICQVLLS